MIEEQIQQIPFELSLLRKVQQYQVNPVLAPTLDDVMRYRQLLLNKQLYAPLTEADQQELQTLYQWIEDNTNLYVEIGETDKMKFSIGFSRESFMSLLPQMSEIKQENSLTHFWVCLYYSLVKFHYMLPMNFYQWRKDLETMLSSLSLPAAYESKASALNAKGIFKDMFDKECWTFEDFYKKENDQTSDEAQKSPNKSRQEADARRVFVKIQIAFDYIKKILLGIPLTQPVAQ